MILKRFNTSKPIITSLIAESEDNYGILPDHIFSQAIDEYKANENEVMDEMMKHQTHTFRRNSNGWYVESIINNN